MEEAPTAIAQTIRYEVKDFIAHPRDPKKGKQTSSELAQFFVDVATHLPEEKLLHCLHALFDAYQLHSPKTKSSAFFGRLALALAEPFGGEAYKATLERFKNAEDPDKSFSLEARKQILIFYKAIINKKITLSADQNRTLSYLFADVLIQKKDKALRENILAAVDAYLQEEPTTYAEAANKCPEQIALFKDLFPTAESLLYSQPLPGPKHLPEPKTVLGLFDVDNNILAIALEPHPPIGQFLANLINSKRMIQNADIKTSAKPILECLYLIVSYEHTKKTLKKNAFIKALIKNLVALLLLQEVSIESLSNHTQNKSFLLTFKKKMSTHLEELGLTPPEADSALAQLFSTVNDETTDKKLRQNILTALLNYFTSAIKKENVDSCSNPTVQGWLANLPGVDIKLKEEILAEATQASANQSRNTAGIKAMLTLSRRSQDAGRETSSVNNDNNSTGKRRTPLFGRKKNDDE